MDGSVGRDGRRRIYRRGFADFTREGIFALGSFPFGVTVRFT